MKLYSKKIMLQFFMDEYLETAFSIAGYKISFLTISVVVNILTAWFLWEGYKKTDFIRFALNKVFDIMEEMALKYAGSKQHAPILFGLFLSISIANALRCFSIYPLNAIYHFPIAFALLAFFYTLFMGFKKFGFKCFWNLVPLSLPLPIKIFLFPIEFSLFFLKPLTLCARLLLNIFIGHVISHILFMVCLKFGAYSIITLPVLLFINILEFAMGFLQAYLFSLFTSLMIGSLVHPH